MDSHIDILSVSLRSPNSFIHIFSLIPLPLLPATLYTHLFLLYLYIGSYYKSKYKGIMPEAFNSNSHGSARGQKISLFINPGGC
jgi:hypothetical protein